MLIQIFNWFSRVLLEFVPIYILYTLYIKRITTITIIFTSFPYYQNLRQVTKVYSLSLLGYVGWWWWFGLLSTRHAYLSPNNKTASDTVEAVEQPSMHTCPTCHRILTGKTG